MQHRETGGEQNHPLQPISQWAIGVSFGGAKNVWSMQGGHPARWCPSRRYNGLFRCAKCAQKYHGRGSGQLQRCSRRQSLANDSSAALVLRQRQTQPRMRLVRGSIGQKRQKFVHERLHSLGRTNRTEICLHSLKFLDHDVIDHLGRNSIVLGLTHQIKKYFRPEVNGRSRFGSKCTKFHRTQHSGLSAPEQSVMFLVVTGYIAVLGLNFRFQNSQTEKTASSCFGLKPFSCC